MGMKHKPSDMPNLENRTDEAYERRIFAATRLASGQPRVKVLLDLVEKYKVKRNTAREDIKIAIGRILPATHALGTIEERVSEGLARTEAHYKACMDNGMWGPATTTLKLLIAILGANADQAVARERLELERTASKLRELQLRQQQSKVAQVALEDYTDTQLVSHIDQLKQKLGQDSPKDPTN